MNITPRKVLCHQATLAIIILAGSLSSLRAQSPTPLNDLTYEFTFNPAAMDFNIADPLNRFKTQLDCPYQRDL